jgi:hypothetical protein
MSGRGMKYEIRLPIPVARPAKRVKARAMRIFPSTVNKRMDYILICCLYRIEVSSIGIVRFEAAGKGIWMMAI